MTSANPSIPSVTIVVLNWNARQFLPDCLTALLDLNYPKLQIVVVDNSSSDDSVELVRQSFPAVKLICSQANQGFAAGNNLALRRADTDFVVLVNPDVIVDADWLHQLILPMQADETVGITGSKLFYPGRTLIQHAGGYITSPQALPGHYGLRENDTGQYDEVRDVDYVIGASLAVRREVIEQIGLMDEGFFLYFEECDWCARARRAGYRVLYVPQATAVHVESVTVTRDNVGYFQTFHTSRWRYLLKHFPLEEVLTKTVAAEKAWLATLPPLHRHGAAYAYGATYKKLAEIWRARLRDKAMAATPDEQKQMALALEALRTLAWHSPFLETNAANDSSLWRKMTVRERPFISHLPLIGQGVAWLRTLWNNVAARYYLQALLQQQNELNRRVTIYLNQHQEKLKQQNNSGLSMSQTVTKLQAQLSEIDQQVRALEARFTRLAARK